MNDKILVQDKHGNQIKGGLGWEINLVDGWYLIGYDHQLTTDYWDFANELGCDEDYVMKFAHWLVNIQPSTVQVLAYFDVFRRGECSYIISTQPINSDYFKLNFQLYKLIHPPSH